MQCASAKANDPKGIEMYHEQWKIAWETQERDGPGCSRVELGRSLEYFESEPQV